MYRTKHFSGSTVQTLIENKGKLLPYLSVNKVFLPIKIAYFLNFGAMVCMVPYLPVYMTYLGLSATQVGIVNGVVPLTRIFTGILLGMLTDRYSKHKVFLIASIIIPMISFTSFYFVPRIQYLNDTIPWTHIENSSTSLMLLHSAPLSEKISSERNLNFFPTSTDNSTAIFWIVLAISFVGKTGRGCFNTIMDTSCQKLTKQHNAEFGRQRLWGAVAWGILSPIAGLAIDEFHPTTLFSNKYFLIFVMFNILLLLSIPSVILIKVPPHEQPESISRDISSVICNPLFVLFLICSLVCGIVFGVINTYLFIFLQEVLNAPHYLMGLTLTLTCIAEVPVMFYAKKLLDIMGHTNIMNIVILTWGLRSFLYSTLQSAYWVLPIELLHGITFGLFFPTLTSFVMLISPEGTQTTVQAIFTGTYIGAGFGIGMLGGGLVYDAYGGRNLFRAAGAMCGGTFLIMLIIELVLRHWRTLSVRSVQYETI